MQALDSGADDCLLKPFSFTELSARVRALMHRRPLAAELVMKVDDLELNRVERTVRRAGKRIELTSKEFGLLEYLVRNAGHRITRNMIVEHVWNLSFDTGTNIRLADIFHGLSQPLTTLECGLELALRYDTTLAEVRHRLKVLHETARVLHERLVELRATRDMTTVVERTRFVDSQNSSHQ